MHSTFGAKVFKATLSFEENAVCLEVRTTVADSISRKSTMDLDCSEFGRG